MPYRRWTLVAFLVLTTHSLPPSLQAQWTTGVGGAGGGDMRGGGGMPGGGSGGGPGGRGGMPGRPPGQRMEFPTAEELEGPIAAAAMARVADLDSSATARYAERYVPHMAATEPVRDSLRTMLRSLREGRDSGDWDSMAAEMRERGPVVSRLWKDLSKRDKQFYKDATKPFTKDERKKFEQWQEDKQKAYDAERRRGPGGAGRPGRGPG